VTSFNIVIDEPVEGAEDSLRFLGKKYNVRTSFLNDFTEHLVVLYLLQRSRTSIGFWARATTRLTDQKVSM